MSSSVGTELPNVSKGQEIYVLESTEIVPTSSGCCRSTGTMDSLVGLEDGDDGGTRCHSSEHTQNEVDAMVSTMSAPGSFFVWHSCASLGAIRSRSGRHSAHPFTSLAQAQLQLHLRICHVKKTLSATPSQCRYKHETQSPISKPSNVKSGSSDTSAIFMFSWSELE